MKKRQKAIVTIIFALLVIGGCGKSGDDQNAEDYVGTKQPDNINIEKMENSKTAEKGMETDKSEAEELPEKIEGFIQDQSFEVELDDWGEVYFVSIAPADNMESPHFELIKNGMVVYKFPETNHSKSDHYVRVCAVSFQDYNGDGKKDVIVLIQYSNGTGMWNEPQIFLRENPDNMLYLDYPELENYRVNADAQQESGFYRDTLLEEYLSKQQLTDSVSDIAGTWTSYIEYVGALWIQ